MFIKKVIGKILSLVRYSGRKDPFKIFMKMEGSKDVLNHQCLNKKLLILPIRVTPTSNLFEGIVGYAQKLRGYDVYCLLDGGALNYSENINISKSRFLHTCLSVYEQSRFYKVFGFKPLFFKKIIDQTELKKVMKKLSALSCDELSNFEYKDIHIGLHARYGLMRYLMVETITTAHRDLLVEFLISALKTQIATEKAILKISPDRALLSHGCYSTWGTALEVLKKHKIESTIWGRGYVGNGNLLLSHNDSYLFEYINEPNYLWENDELTSEQKDKTVNYYSGKRIRGNKVDGLSYYKASVGDSDDYSALKNKAKAYATNIGIYPNIPWDGTMFSGVDEFPTMKVFVTKIKEYVENNSDVHFIIRAHPAEIERKTDQSRERFVDILDSVFTTLPNNVTFIAPTGDVTSYQVSEVCNAALLFGSTLSLEFAVARHPVIQVGRTNTTNKGIIFESPTVSDLYTNLNEVKNNNLEMSDEMHMRAIKYAHHWIFRKHVPETLLELSGMGFCDYRFKSKTELMPGVNPVLDLICNNIDNRKPVLVK